MRAQPLEQHHRVEMVADGVPRGEEPGLDPRHLRETGRRAKELLETFRGASEASTDAVLSALPGCEAR